MKKNNLSIHSENILPIIKKWLYSEKEIFLRELVSNATDALKKAKILREEGLLERNEGEFSISLSIDPKARTISIEDTGIGMSEAEVEKYIAQIAFSGAEEFVSKYKKQTESEPIIGHFGLGFYSSYMVASKVEIETLSYRKEDAPVFWSCDGSSSYLLDTGKREMRGTKITLFLDAESSEFLEEKKLKDLLLRHSKFLPFPIALNETPIDNSPPLWLKAPSECTESEYLAFYRRLYPLEADPIFWVHLNVDYPFRLQGILYFPKQKKRFDGSDGSIQLYCNRVFVSDNCKEILPDYLMVLKGAIDSPDIPLNVSRSYLQVDKNVRQLSAHIVKKVADRLTSLYKTDKERYTSLWPDLELFVKLGLLQDPKFYEKVQEALLFKTTHESGWTLLSEYKSRNPEGPEGKVLYTPLEKGAPLLALYLEKGKEVLLLPSPLDTAVLQSLEDREKVTFQRIDGALEKELLDPSKEKNLLDAEGKTEAGRLSLFFKSALQEKGEIEVEAKSLASQTLPALVLVSEEDLRLRSYLALTQKSSERFPIKKQFIVNTNHPLVQSIQKLEQKNSPLAQELAKSLYDLSLLSQKELEPEEFEGAIGRQTAVLEKLAQALAP